MATPDSTAVLSLLGFRRDKFWSLVNKTETCWLWTGHRTRYGYGRFSVRGRMEYVHRLSYTDARQVEIPPGMLICHHCDVRTCVRPDHLFLGTADDNAQDAARKGRFPAQQRTHCPKGHPYSGSNLIQLHRRRECRACMNARSAAYKRNNPDYMRNWHRRRAANGANNG